MPQEIEAPGAKEFRRLIGGAHAAKLSGHWAGSAFRRHPRGIIRERMIFTDEWNIHDYCSVKVVLEPDAEIIPGCNSPAAHCNPYPKPSKGELYEVYANGRWTAPDGPWRERILAILDDVRAELAEHQKAQDEAKRKEAEKCAAHLAEKEAKARAAFAGN